MLIFLMYIILQSIASLFAMLALLFPRQQNETFLTTLCRNEFFIFFQWSFALPSFWLGKQLKLSIPVLFLTSYIIGFAIQLLFISFYLKQTVKYTDYIAIIIMFIGLYITTYSQGEIVGVVDVV